MNFKGYLIGQRMWHLSSTPKGLRLRSYQDHSLWLPYEPYQAICPNRWTHDPPNLNCSCGIYAVKEFGERYHRFGPIWGRVALWGNYIEGQLGYRAQYAYPIAFTKFFCANCSRSKDLGQLTAYVGTADQRLTLSPRMVTFGCEGCGPPPGDGLGAMPARDLVSVLTHAYGLESRILQES